MDEHHSISETLRGAIRRSGKSRRTVARESGLGVMTISRFLAGGKIATALALRKLAESLGYRLIAVPVDTGQDDACVDVQDA